MKHPHSNHNESNRQSKPVSQPAGKSVPPARVDRGRIHLNPVHYDHPYPSMDEFAKLLALRYDGNRTPYSYYPITGTCACSTSISSAPRLP